MRFRRRRRSTSTEGNPAAAAGQGGKRKPAAGSSSTGSTLAEADLRIAKANINDLQKQLAEVVSQRDELHLQLYKSVDLANQQLGSAARAANTLVHAHAKQLRTTKATTSKAIAKMKAMRQHAHAFAEGMLATRRGRSSRPHLVLGRIQRPPRRHADQEALGQAEE